MRFANCCRCRLLQEHVNVNIQVSSAKLEFRLKINRIAMQSTLLLKFSGVAGYNQKVNDVLFVSKQNVSEPSSVVIFFGGDVQVI